MTDGALNTTSKVTADSIGAIGAFSIGIGGIVGGGIFATLGIAANGSRGSTYISFLVGGAIALLTAYSYVHLSLTYPGKGGTVTFIEHGFGKGLFGSSMNVLLIFSYIILLAVYADAFGTYAANFFPVDQRYYWHVGLRSAVIVLMALINLLGPSLVERSEGFFNVGKLGILALFVVAGLAGSGLTFSRLGPSDWVGLPKIIASGMAVFLSYEGFELIANASDRIRNPHRNIPLAFYGSVTMSIVLYFFIIVVTLGYLSFEALQAAANYPLSAAASVFMGTTGFLLLYAVISGRDPGDGVGHQCGHLRSIETTDHPGADGRSRRNMGPRSLAEASGRLDLRRCLGAGDFQSPEPACHVKCGKRWLSGDLRTG